MKPPPSLLLSETRRFVAARLFVLAYRPSGKAIRQFEAGFAPKIRRRAVSLFAKNRRHLS